MPDLQQIQITIRDNWPNIKLLVYSGNQLVASDERQYDVALPNFEVRIKNVLQQTVDRICRAHHATS